MNNKIDALNNKINGDIGLVQQSIQGLVNDLKQKGISNFQWSSAGPVSGMICIQLIEVADPHTWNDNYLCYTR